MGGSMMAILNPTFPRRLAMIRPLLNPVSRRWRDSRSLWQHRACFSSSATSSRTNAFGSAVFGVLVAGTGGLGVWQSQRYFWKKGLIEEIERSLNREPVALPVGVSYDDALEADWSSPLKGRVSVRGTFDHSREVLIGPRTPAKDLLPRAKHVSSMEPNPLGYLVFTPLERDDGSGHVIVNRGWVPVSLMPNDTKATGKSTGTSSAAGKDSGISRPEGVVEVTGILVAGESKGGVFLPENKSSGRNLLWVQHEALVEATELKPEERPVLLEVCRGELPSDGREQWPMPKQAHHFGAFFVSPFSHLMYAATWFCLAGFGAMMTRSRFGSGGGRRGMIVNKKPGHQS